MPITIHELAVERGIHDDGTGQFSGQDYEDVGLAILGGCFACSATIAAYNACPSRQGFWFCQDCIGEYGYESAAEANADIFPTFTISLHIDSENEAGVTVTGGGKVHNLTDLIACNPQDVAFYGHTDKVAEMCALAGELAYARNRQNITQEQFEAAGKALGFEIHPMGEGTD